MPFLKQKLPWIYRHFDQIIFYDLSTFDGLFNFSTDGGHQYIKNFPDPEGKITLIETRHQIQFQYPNGKPTNPIKMRMFPYASGFVKEDIDVFWATDMDEFFTEKLIKEVENIFSTTNANAIRTDHYEFWNDFDTVLVKEDKNPLTEWTLDRIARHKPGNIYGHCNIGDVYRPVYKAMHPIYHFSNVGKEKTFNKIYNWYKGSHQTYMNIWAKYENMELEDGVVYGYPDMHPNPQLDFGIMRYPWDLRAELDYVDFDELSRDMKTIDP